MLCVVPIEYGGYVGGGEVAKLHAEKFHGNVPQKFAADGTGEGDHVAAKAQVREVYGVLAQELVPQAHIAEPLPGERVWCLESFGLSGSHRASAFAFALPR
jgi:hypothetical protein